MCKIDSFYSTPDEQRLSTDLRETHGDVLRLQDQVKRLAERADDLKRERAKLTNDLAHKQREAIEQRQLARHAKEALEDSVKREDYYRDASGRDRWRGEYEDAARFATQYERERDEAREHYEGARTAVDIYADEIRKAEARAERLAARVSALSKALRFYGGSGWDDDKPQWDGGAVANAALRADGDAMFAALADAPGSVRIEMCISERCEHWFPGDNLGNPPQCNADDSEPCPPADAPGPKPCGRCELLGGHLYTALYGTWDGPAMSAADRDLNLCRPRPPGADAPTSGREEADGG
jgi:hypothetical protein